jgi:hypothetical protein
MRLELFAAIKPSIQRSSNPLQAVGADESHPVIRGRYGEMFQWPDKGSIFKMIAIGRCLRSTIHLVILKGVRNDWQSGIHYNGT